MAKRQITRWAGCAALAACCAGAAHAAEPSPLVMTSEAGKTVCRTAPVQLGSTQAEATLCVTSANFAHDIYALRLGEDAVVKGIDDETTHGILGKWHDQAIALVCVPRVESPKVVSPEKIAAFQKVMPQISHNEARMMVLATESVEVGRQCFVKGEGTQVLMQVQVYSPK